MSRYQAYQELLAGRSVGETFGRTTDFHDLVVRAVRASARPPPMRRPTSATLTQRPVAAEANGERRA